MTRSELVTLALGSAGGQTPFTPVQVQKLFFLIDREIGPQIGGPHFAFAPYDYGPFDGNVYRELEALCRQGLVHIEPAGSLKYYSLTGAGLAAANAISRNEDFRTRDYIQRAAVWVRSLGFADLVSAIYRKYPDMQVNSVFQR
jgi:uncharacterized protein